MENQVTQRTRFSGLLADSSEWGMFGENADDFAALLNDSFVKFNNDQSLTTEQVFDNMAALIESLERDVNMIIVDNKPRAMLRVYWYLSFSDPDWTHNNVSIITH